jgi:hypothetical protein
VLLTMVAALGPAACKSAPDNDDAADCGPTATTGRPPAASGPRSGPTGAAGSASLAPHSAPPPTAPPQPTPTPTVVGGRVTLTAANTGQTIVVPAGTLIDVRLEPVSGALWTVPESSNAQALPRLSASGPCDTVKTATFRAAGDGEIDATRPHGDAIGRLVVTVHIGG